MYSHSVSVSVNCVPASFCTDPNQIKSRTGLILSLSLNKFPRVVAALHQLSNIQEKHAPLSDEETRRPVGGWCLLFVILKTRTVFFSAWSHEALSGFSLNFGCVQKTTRCMAKLSVSLPGILLFKTVSSCHYITRAKVCLQSLI